MRRVGGRATWALWLDDSTNSALKTISSRLFLPIPFPVLGSTNARSSRIEGCREKGTRFVRCSTLRYAVRGDPFPKTWLKKGPVFADSRRMELTAVCVVHFLFKDRDSFDAHDPSWAELLIGVGNDIGWIINTTKSLASSDPLVSEALKKMSKTPSKAEDVPMLLNSTFCRRIRGVRNTQAFGRRGAETPNENSSIIITAVIETTNIELRAGAQTRLKLLQ